MIASLSLVLALAPMQAKNTDPMTILKAANTAGKSLKTIKYSVESKPGKAVVRATVWQEPSDDDSLGFLKGRFRIKGSMDSDNGSEFFEMAYDGQALRIKNDSDKTTVIENPTAYEAGQYSPMGVMYSTLPMTGIRFIGEPKLTAKYLGSRKVGKWTCDVIEVRRRVQSPAEGEIELVSEWAFDRASHLPVQNKSKTSTTTVTSFEVNPKIDAGVFKMSGSTVAASKLGPNTEELLAQNSAAPDFTVEVPGGGTKSLADYKGKVVVLDFWGTWCVPCRQVMPVLDEIHKTYRGRGVEVLGISVDHEMDPVAYMKREGHSYPIGLKGHEAAKTYLAQLLPTVYIIDQEGRIAFRFAGIPEGGAGILVDEVKKLVAAPSQA